MNIIEFINSAGLKFVDFAVPMLIQSSVLIVFLLAGDLLLRKKVRAVFRYCLWLLVLAKLVLPVSPSSPVALGYLVGDELTNIKISETVGEPSPANVARIVEKSQAPSVMYEPPVMPIVIPKIIDIEPIALLRPAVSEPIVVPVQVSWQGIVFAG